jgi:hypothetical protein
MANGWTVLMYATAAGECPTQAFLDGLRGEQADQAAALIRKLAALGNALRRPHSAALEAGLWEMRRHQVRIFYTFRPGHLAVLLDGMVKKQDEVPPAMMARLRRLLADVPAWERRTARPGG